MTKDSNRLPMRELLAQQQAGPRITPAEAARQRRSGRRGSAPDSADSDSARSGRQVDATQWPDDLAPAAETTAETSQGRVTRGQPPETVDAAARQASAATPVEGIRAGVMAQVKEHASEGADIVNRAAPGPVRRTVSRAAGKKRTLLAAACAVAVPVVWWVMAARRSRRVRLLVRTGK